MAGEAGKEQPCEYGGRDMGRKGSIHDSYAYPSLLLIPPSIFLPLTAGGLIGRPCPIAFIDATAPPIDTPIAAPPPEPDPVVGPRFGFRGDMPLSLPTVALPSTEEREVGFFLMPAVLGGRPAVLGAEL